MRSQQPFILLKVVKVHRKAIHPIVEMALSCLVGVALLASCGGPTTAPNQPPSTPAPEAPEGELVWRYDIASSRTVFLIGNSIFPPAVADSTVFVVAVDGNVYALTASSGELLWSYKTGSVARSAPTLADGIVYVMTEDELHALDAGTGDHLWQGPPTINSPRVIDGVVYATNGGLEALDAANGELLWHYQTGGLIRHSPTVAGGMVCWGTDWEHLYALDVSTGELKWRHEISTTMYASPVVADGVAYAITFDGDLYALDASTGELIWHSQIPGNVSSILEVVDGLVYVHTDDWHAVEATTGEQIWSLSQREYGGVYESNLGSYFGLAYFSISDGVMYFGSNLGDVLAVEATSGDLIWRGRTFSGDPAAPTVFGDMVYAGSLDGGVYALDAANGEWLWFYQTDAPILSFPIVIDDLIYVGSWDGSVYALRAPASQ